jgi:hypothetical protein
VLELLEPKARDEQLLTYTHVNENFKWHELSRLTGHLIEHDEPKGMLSRHLIRPGSKNNGYRIMIALLWLKLFTGRSMSGIVASR